MSEMPEVIMTSEMTVVLKQSLASDQMVVDAARVSNGGDTSSAKNPDGSARGLIEYLMRARHGSPFEHNLFTFYLKVPLFVAREHFRHRISSFNEMSGRWGEMLPEFYTPPAHRPLVNIGTKPSQPVMVSGDSKQQSLMESGDLTMAQYAWHEYQVRLDSGISNEMARTILPLHTMTQYYWTTNARSLMNFLSLRIESDQSLFRSYPQWEIAKAAERIEQEFYKKMPLTHGAFIKSKRVAP